MIYMRTHRPHATVNLSIPIISGLVPNIDTLTADVMVLNIYAQVLLLPNIPKTDRYKK